MLHPDALARVEAYPGPLAHDRTSMGGQIIAQQLDRSTLNQPVGRLCTRTGSVHLHNVKLIGQARSDLFADYIGAVERGEMVCPMIEPYYREHKYCTVKDLFDGGHPPDSVVGMALAYYAFRRGRRPGDLGLS